MKIEELYLDMTGTPLTVGVSGDGLNPDVDASKLAEDIRVSLVGKAASETDPAELIHRLGSGLEAEDVFINDVPGHCSAKIFFDENREDLVLTGADMTEIAKTFFVDLRDQHGQKGIEKILGLTDDAFDTIYTGVFGQNWEEIVNR